MNDKLHDVPDDIKDLILQTDEPKDKALLLILLKIAESLTDNTTITRKLSQTIDEHVDRFAEHEKKDNETRAQGRGFVRGSLCALAIFQGAAAWYGKSVLDEYGDMKTEVRNMQIEIEKHKEHHRQEERFSVGPKVK